MAQKYFLHGRYLNQCQPPKPGDVKPFLAGIQGEPVQEDSDFRLHLDEVTEKWEMVFAKLESPHIGTRPLRIPAEVCLSNSCRLVGNQKNRRSNTSVNLREVPGNSLQKRSKGFRKNSAHHHSSSASSSSDYVFATKQHKGFEPVTPHAKTAWTMPQHAVSMLSGPIKPCASKTHAKQGLQISVKTCGHTLASLSREALLPFDPSSVPE